MRGVGLGGGEFERCLVSALAGGEWGGFTIAGRELLRGGVSASRARSTMMTAKDWRNTKSGTTTTGWLKLR